MSKYTSALERIQAERLARADHPHADASDGSSSPTSDSDSVMREPEIVSIYEGKDAHPARGYAADKIAHKRFSKETLHVALGGALFLLGVMYVLGCNRAFRSADAMVGAVPAPVESGETKELTAAVKDNDFLPAPPAEKHTPSTEKDLVVATFDSGIPTNQVDGSFGAWDKDPDDDTQKCLTAFSPGEDALGDERGYALRLAYDVDSPHPAYNGFWMKLNYADVSTYNTLRFYIKGDADAGFTSRVKIELKDVTNTSGYLLSGITDTWRRVEIPLNKFRQIDHWNALTEFVIVFEDTKSSPKTGALFLDELSFANV